MDHRSLNAPTLIISSSERLLSPLLSRRLAVSLASFSSLNYLSITRGAYQGVRPSIRGLIISHVCYCFFLHRSSFLRDAAPWACRCTYTRSYFYHTVRSYVRSTCLIIHSISRPISPFWVLPPSPSPSPALLPAHNFPGPFSGVDRPATVLGFNLFNLFFGELTFSVIHDKTSFSLVLTLVAYSRPLTSPSFRDRPDRKSVV